MSLEDDVQSTPFKPGEPFPDSNKHPRLVYTRDFLLSLSDLDVCKKLPIGFDPSILSDLEDTSQSLQERQRIPGSFPFRRNEYSSSPPIKGDAHSSSRGIYGRWDSRSSERSEKDSDSQSDSAPDPGRRFCNDSRRSGQSPEHDGLLGRPSGYSGGFSAPKIRCNENFPVNKSSEPYHPPRPYKAVPYTRRDKDSFNDETFGSLEGTSHDRVEEEKRRRESFELMRKEQQKSFQGKVKLNSDNHKDDPFSDISESLEGSKDEKRVFSRSSELDVPAKQVAPKNESSKSSFPPPGCRPLIPPGFKGSVPERSSNSRSSFPRHSAEAGKRETENISSHAEASIQNGIHANQEERHPIQVMGFQLQPEKNPGVQALSTTKDEQVMNPSLDFDTTTKLGEGNQLKWSSKLLEPSGTRENVGFDNKKVIPTHEIIGNPEQDHPRSLLENLFGSTDSPFVQHHDTNWAPTRNNSTSQSSKLSTWLPEDGKHAAEEDQSHVKQNNWLSLLDGGKETHSSDLKSTQLVPPDIPFQHSELSAKQLTSRNGMSEEFTNSNKQETLSAILTCEDLEQTILSEYGEGPTLQAHVHRLDASGAKIKDSKKAGSVDHASQHLLSLLQKGPGLGAITQFPNHETAFSEKPQVSEGVTSGSDVHHSGNSLKLETLFGSAFMEELQSVKAPVSVQRALDAANQREQLNADGNSLEDNTQVEMSRSKHQDDIVWKHGGPVDIHLPEEESLITVGNPLSGSNSLFISAGNTQERDLGHANKMVNVPEGLEGLSMGFNGGLVTGNRYNPGKHGIPFNNLHAPSSSPPFHAHPQMNHGARRPFFHPLDSHIIDHDAQFPANMPHPSLRPTNTGLSGVNLPHPMLQQMQMRGNIPPPHMLREFPRHGPSPPQPSNPMESFPLMQLRPNFAGPGSPLQAVNGRSNHHPEAFQRLMELRANGGGGHNQGTYGQELNAGFRYR